MKQASKLSGAVGPSGVDAETMKHWLLQYNVVSENLGKEMAEWVTLLSNSSLDYYAMYHAFDSARMLAVDIYPGVRPLACGEIYMKLQGQYNLEGNVKALACSVYGNLQTYVGIQAGIRGNLHMIRSD